MNDMLRLLGFFVIIGLGIYVIATWIYPHFKATTNHPILYTVLLFFGVMAIGSVFSRKNTGIYGSFFGFQLSRSLIKAVMR
jgi:putative effector of murein hydrolase